MREERDHTSERTESTTNHRKDETQGKDLDEEEEHETAGIHAAETDAADKSAVPAGAAGHEALVEADDEEADHDEHAQEHDADEDEKEDDHR